MSLTVYKKKRDLKKTAEPAAKTSGNGVSKLSFVIHRHQASHLHYDFRLEMDGVLKSWAVPKGPSMKPGDKRLAIQVEDHPYAYKKFEGVIPKGNYGAGTVEIWDSGSYTDSIHSDKTMAEKNMLKGLKAGHLKFRMYGKKLKGEFVLIRTKSLGEHSWLLIKHKDEFVREEKNGNEKKNKKIP